MRRYRHALARIAVVTAVAATGAAALPGTASAAPKPPPPKPTCHLVLDAAGDARSRDLDVLSGDLASDATLVAGVLRLASLTPTDPLALTGARWDLAFTVGTTRYTYTMRRDAAGELSATFTRTPAGGTPVTSLAMATYDVARREIRWTVLRSAIPELPAIPAGDLLRDIVATTYATPADLVEDIAFGKPYPDGNPSCVTPG